MPLTGGSMQEAGQPGETERVVWVELMDDQYVLRTPSYSAGATNVLRELRSAASIMQLERKYQYRNSLMDSSLGFLHLSIKLKPVFPPVGGDEDVSFPCPTRSKTN
ncbi:hypothetical protein EYF80_018137 [Liparis tanakae]|uniref:Uncharacterized protein n=1 Tax=Liparis tanakae TaxID=230148 RepID=A0A4Z2I2Y5_9TELE|nr:hypothetical protein EYF80_018137 [Liparis tanakae]